METDYLSVIQDAINTFIKRGIIKDVGQNLSKIQLQDVENKLGCELPESFKYFLKVTGNIGSFPNDISRMFFPNILLIQSELYSSLKESLSHEAVEPLLSKKPIAYFTSQMTYFEVFLSDEKSKDPMTYYWICGDENFTSSGRQLSESILRLANLI
jgi:hypothetical protein